MDKQGGMITVNKNHDVFTLPAYFLLNRKYILLFSLTILDNQNRAKADWKRNIPPPLVIGKFCKCKVYINILIIPPVPIYQLIGRCIPVNGSWYRLLKIMLPERKGPY